jgi:K+-sensing histidine kinase KdpD
MPSTALLPKLTLRNARAWAPRRNIKWLMLVAAFLLALVLRLALHEHLGPRYPLLFFTMATLLVHFFFGLKPAVVLALISLPTGMYLFVPPYMSFTIVDRDDLLRVTNYVVVTAIFMVLIQYLRRAQYQAALFYEIAESRYLMLLDSEADRSAIEEEIQRREV